MEVTHKSNWEKEKKYRPCHRLETFSSALTQSDTSPRVVAQLPRCMQLFVTQGLQHARPPCASPPPRVCPHLRLLHLIFWHRLLLLPSVFSSIRYFSNEASVCIRWPKYWSFSFSISPYRQYSQLISLKIDCFVLPAVQGTFRSLLQHHSVKASILWHSAFSMVWFSQQNVTPRKTIALTIQTFVDRVMSLLFNTLTRFVITFLPRSNCLLIS